MYGSGKRVSVSGVGSRVQGSWFRVQGSGLRVQGSGFRVQGAGCRVQGSGFGELLDEATHSRLPRESEHLRQQVTSPSDLVFGVEHPQVLGLSLGESEHLRVWRLRLWCHGEELCSPRQKSRAERLKEKVESLLT